MKNLFSDTYFEARKRFVHATKVQSYRSSHSGPEGQPLSTDVAYLGDPDADHLLVSIAGTHGVEGYCGSAAQLSLLQSQLGNSLGGSVGILLIQALNAYGFAWDRRVTAEGCDLNRNFVDFSKPLPENPGYDELADHLVPSDLSVESLAVAEHAIAEFRSTHGEAAFQTARKKGQYSRPEGMFFGGKHPSEPREILESICRDYRVAERQNVIIVDYHTGLGPYGYGELQTETSSGLDGYHRALEIFGPSVTSPDLGTSSSVAITGTQDEFWQGGAGQPAHLCVPGVWHLQPGQRPRSPPRRSLAFRVPPRPSQHRDWEADTKRHAGTLQPRPARLAGNGPVSLRPGPSPGSCRVDAGEMMPLNPSN